MSALQFDFAQHKLSQPLPDSDIHICCASLERNKYEIAELFSLLSSDEKARSERFYFEKDRNRYTVGRGLLRVILSGYLEIEPSQIEFVYGNQGKPALKSKMQGKVFEFNLSHSKDLALYILSWNRKVGIDVEYNQPMANMDDLAEKFFTPPESALIHSLFGDQKRETFYKIWTCKEAYLKALGTGLTKPLDLVEIALESEQAAKLMSRDGVECEGWHLGLFSPQTNYQGAVAVEGDDLRIIFQTLDRQAIFIQK